MTLNIYIICAVRNAAPERVAAIRAYAQAKRSEGHHVHFPPDDAPQEDPTGEAICRTHLAAMKAADEVHIFWDVKSSGSHFDLGMAYALGKKLVPVACEHPDGPEKSYWKVMKSLAPTLAERVCALSHRFGFDSPEARTLTEAAELLRSLEK